MLRSLAFSSDSYGRSSSDFGDHVVAFIVSYKVVINDLLLSVTAEGDQKVAALKYEKMKS